MHVHTCYSHDATTTPKELIQYAKNQGLNGVAITDHNTFKAAQEISRKTKDFIVIPGIEINTKQGHVLALNPTRNIPFGHGLYETVEMIHEANGIAIASHPTSIKKGMKKQLNTKFDAVEVINSSSFPFFFSTYQNRKLAQALNLPQTAGSDAHTPFDIGTAYTIINAEPQIDKIIKAIKKGETQPVGKPISWKNRLKRLLQKGEASVKGLPSDTNSNPLEEAFLAQRKAPCHKAAEQSWQIRSTNKANAHRS